MSRSPMISKPSPARVPPRAVAAAMPEMRWRPSLADHPFHSEIFAPATEASGAGLALARARVAVTSVGEGEAAEDTRHVLGGQDRKALRFGGRPGRA
ncbi:MAG: hypothetical protein ACK554_03380, partial [Erythrobacteraceae bacterium]